MHQDIPRRARREIPRLHHPPIRPRQRRTITVTPQRRQIALHRIHVRISRRHPQSRAPSAIRRILRIEPEIVIPRCRRRGHIGARAEMRRAVVPSQVHDVAFLNNRCCRIRQNIRPHRRLQIHVKNLRKLPIHIIDDRNRERLRQRIRRNGQRHQRHRRIITRLDGRAIRRKIIHRHRLRRNLRKRHREHRIPHVLRDGYIRDHDGRRVGVVQRNHGHRGCPAAHVIHIRAPAIGCSRVVIYSPHHHTRAGDCHRVAEVVSILRAGVVQRDHGHRRRAAAHVIYIRAPRVGRARAVPYSPHHHPRAGDRHRDAEVVIRRRAGIGQQEEQCPGR